MGGTADFTRFRLSSANGSKTSTKILGKSVFLMGHLRNAVVDIFRRLPSPALAPLHHGRREAKRMGFDTQVLISPLGMTLEPSRTTKWGLLTRSSAELKGQRKSTKTKSRQITPILRKIATMSWYKFLKKTSPTSNFYSRHVRRSGII